MKILDLTGEKFGRLTVLKYAFSKEGKRFWECRCSCGKIITATTARLRNGSVKSCGCFRREALLEGHKVRKGKHFADWTGRVFGRLTVVGRDETSPGRKWICLCSCGRTTSVIASNLGRVTNSCGCLQREIQKTGSITHGLRKSRLYVTWANMKQRCNNPNHRQFKWYGARGIKLCPEWNDNFGKFAEWAFSHGYRENLTIERIDPDKGYLPENCEWITKEENSRRMQEYKKAHNRHLT